MQRLLPFGFLSALLLFIALFGTSLVEPMPAYAQEISASIPNLAGMNIYFSETYQELSQFDRTNAGISRFAGLLRLAGANLFTLEWRKGIPADANLIVIVGPSLDLSSDNVARLWSYLQGGGRVLLMADAFDNRGLVSRALITTGLFQLTWADLGLQARMDVIVRPNGVQEIDIEETNRDGVVTFTYSGEAPIWATDFYTRRVNANHPITSGLLPLLAAEDEAITPNLNSLYFTGARSLQIDSAIQDFNVTPLVFTDMADVYGETDYDRYMTNGYSEYNIGTDSQRGDLILGAAYDDPNSTGRMVLLGDADLVRNGAGFQTSPSYSGSFVYPVNAQLMVRTVAWLLDAEAVNMDFPTPAPTATATITPTPTPAATSTAEAQ
jgi:hypothetical protein